MIDRAGYAPKEHIPDDRAGEDGIPVTGIAVAVADGHRACGRVTRLLRVDDDGPRQSVAPIERALRAAQDLNALDIEQALVNEQRVGDLHAVDHEGDRRLATIRHADAADAE